MKVVNLETIIDMQSCCRTWSPNGSSRIRAKQKLLGKRKGACKSSWSQKRNLKSFTRTIPWKLSKPVKIFLGIIVRRHHTDQKQMGLLKERAVRRVKEWSGLNESLWADSMECSSYLRNIQDFLSDGKTPCERVLVNHSKDQSFRLVHWLSINLSLRKTSQESNNLERKSYLDCSSDTHCTRREFGRVTNWLQTLRSWKRWTHRKSTRKDSMQRK